MELRGGEGIPKQIHPRTQVVGKHRATPLLAMGQLKCDQLLDVLTDTTVEFVFLIARGMAIVSKSKTRPSYKLIS